VTLSDEVFQGLAKAIVSGALEPGRRLDEPSVCQQFGVSRTPVREALRRLSGTGLVEVIPRKGVTVAKIEVEQLTDMFEALGEFEGLCARLSAERMTPLERKRLELLNANRDTTQAKSDQELIAINDQFHELIYQGSHSTSIAGVTRSFRQRLAPFRVLQYVPGRTEYAFHEHDDIVRAIVSGQPERAYRAMRDHVTSSSLSVIEHFTRQRAGADGKALTPPRRTAG
jgi:DNA-binding GntR family transcriptional regulator